ncbi:DUF397 domain-containing protein [Streptomyces hirsutus]|uniref:DUF397 domain-containing protein n=1 Tax=Streptomyces hirsutus TaxID=35620 RepID=A0ABZ1GS29_9ACTN|nr:DUF397 domain-containing protein [Streptomyces hirsutus]WSD08132.1 DUF397 domain-containing protein [Streptomyces hirsutus]
MNFEPSGSASSDSEWIKSSYSTDEGPDCVEVAAVPDRILIRDSKNPQGPRLALPPTTWASFLSYASGH